MPSKNWKISEHEKKHEWKLEETWRSHQFQGSQSASPEDLMWLPRPAVLDRPEEDQDSNDSHRNGMNIQCNGLFTTGGWRIEMIRHMAMDQYLLILINTIFSGMNIHKSQLFWCEQKRGTRVLTHPHIPSLKPRTPQSRWWISGLVNLPGRANTWSRWSGAAAISRCQSPGLLAMSTRFHPFNSNLYNSYMIYYDIIWYSWYLAYNITISLHQHPSTWCNFLGSIQRHDSSKSAADLSRHITCHHEITMRSPWNHHEITMKWQPSHHVTVRVSGCWTSAAGSLPPRHPQRVSHLATGDCGGWNITVATLCGYLDGFNKV